MPDHKRRYESMLFNQASNKKMDHIISVKTALGGTSTTQYKKKETCLRIRPPPLKDINALTDWYVPNVPFDLFGKPKDILGTNPHEVQKPYGRVQDLERKKVQMTRPRLVITPAASLDDVEDGPRKVIIDSVYITSAADTMRNTFTQANHQNIKAPFPGRPAPANPIWIPKLSPSYVSPEWRMDSVSWDNRQLRAHCDPSQEFWLAKPLNCEECKETAARDAMKKMKRKH